MLVVKIICGVIIYFIGVAGFIALDMWRRTICSRHTAAYKTFKQNLLAFLEGELSDKDADILAIGCALLPLGLLLEGFFILLGLICVELKAWCRNDKER